VQLENTFYDAIRERTSENIVNRNKNFQQGEHLAWRYLDSFVKNAMSITVSIFQNLK
jgi:hypothetical protein